MNTPPQGSSFGVPPGSPPFGPPPDGGPPPPGAPPPQGPPPGPYRATSGLEPHRGAAVLALGIFSIVVPLISGLCCMPAGFVGVAFGIPAILMGRADMKKYASGVMDPTGYSSTQAGYICGIIGTCIATLELLATIFVFVIYGSLIGLALLGVGAQGAGY